MLADEILYVKLEVPPNVATPCADKPATRWTIINRSTVPLGVGGPDIQDDDVLFPGESLTVACRAAPHVFHRGGGAIRIPIIIER